MDCLKDKNGMVLDVASSYRSRWKGGKAERRKAEGGRDGTMWPVGRRSSRQGDEKRRKGSRKKRGGSRERGGTIWETSDQKGGTID